MIRAWNWVWSWRWHAEWSILIGSYYGVPIIWPEYIRVWIQKH
jgi:hypothetical protein